VFWERLKVRALSLDISIVLKQYSSATVRQKH